METHGEAPADWWRTFFSGPVVEFWLAAPTQEQTRQETDFLQGALDIAPPAKLLDVPCGGGRHSRALSERGYHMTGVDISPGFLEAARSSPLPGPGTVAWEEREMRDLPWPGEFDGAFCLGNSFGYLGDEGDAAFLRAVARALRPGARFVLDTSYVLEVLLPVLQERSWYEMGELLVLAQRRYDPFTSRLHVEYVCVQGGGEEESRSRVERRSMSARLYSVREVIGLLEEAGFTDVLGYGSLEREPFRLGASRLLAVATKQG